MSKKWENMGPIKRPSASIVMHPSGIVEQTARPGLHAYEDLMMYKVHFYSGTEHLFSTERRTDPVGWDNIWLEAGRRLADCVFEIDSMKVWHYFVDKDGLSIVPVRNGDARIRDMMQSYENARKAA